MKQSYLVFLFLFFAFSGFSQRSNNEANVSTYQQSLNEKEDFWSKVKGVFKPKKDKKQVQRSSDPLLVKNDPNRNVRRVKKDRDNTLTDYSENPNEIPTQKVDEETKSTEKKKKSFSQVWNELVNGKGYTPAKDYSAIRRKQRQQAANSKPLTQHTKGTVLKMNKENVNSLNKNNAQPLTNNFMASKESKKPEVKPNMNKADNINYTKNTKVPVLRNADANSPSKAPKQQNFSVTKSDVIAPKSEQGLHPNDSKPIQAPSKSIAASVQPTNPALATSKQKLASKSTIESQVKELKATEVKSKPTPEPKPKILEMKPTASVDSKPKVIAEVKPKPAADLKPKVLAEAKPKAVTPVVPDNTIRNEIQPLSLTRTASGTAAYFFSGASFGKFYVVTNLALKGEVIKVINTQNGKSLLAEVMDALPSSDVKRGLLLKLSDNAKLPLGQSNKSFSVKVNY